jgi:uncharacterized membrane protein
METPPQQETESQSESQSPFPGVRSGLSPVAPFRWISRGLDDFKACPTASMFYGCCFAAMGFVLNVVLARYYQYVSALACGFLLLGPFLAIGIYEVSRRRQKGLMCALRPTLAAWRSNAGNIGVYSLILSVIFLVWARAGRAPRWWLSPSSTPARCRRWKDSCARCCRCRTRNFS